MRVIELLIKISNGEINRNNKYQFSEDDYCTIDDFFNRYIIDEENLNLEIKENKIPEKINKEEFADLIKESKLWKLFYSYNYLIDYLKDRRII